MYPTPEGPEWKTDTYQICFKQPTNSSHDFYLDVSKGTGLKKSAPVEVQDTKGTVLVDGHSVVLDVQYQDDRGRWVRPPINGRHKIGYIFPDDMPESLRSELTAGTWRASVDNGDKPGIGIELTRDDSHRITGRMFLLDPNHPNDFATGSPRPMQMQHYTAFELHFAVDLRPDVHRQMILRLDSSLGDRKVHGVLESADHSTTPTDLDFVRTK